MKKLRSFETSASTRPTTQGYRECTRVIVVNRTSRLNIVMGYSVLAW